MGKNRNNIKESSVHLAASKARGAWPALHLAVLLFGVAGLFGKWLSLHPVYIVLGRVFFATLALGIYLSITKKWPPRVMREQWLQIGGCGVLLAIHWFAFFQSIQVSSVAVGLLAFATAPVFAAMLEPFWFREAFSWRSLLAAVLSVLGIGLIVPQWTLGNTTVQGLLWGVGAGGSFALLSLLNRGLRKHHDSALLAFWQDAIAVVVLLPSFLWFPLQLTLPDIALLVLLGVFCTALAHALFIHALFAIPARSATLVSNLEPVYGILLAAAFLSEYPGWRTLTGGAIVLATVGWFTINPRGRAV